MNPETAKTIKSIAADVMAAAVGIVFILAWAGFFNCPCK